MDPDKSQTIRHKKASDLILYCLPMSHKKDARLIWVRNTFYTVFLQTVNNKYTLNIDRFNPLAITFSTLVHVNSKTRAYLNEACIYTAL